MSKPEFEIKIELAGHTKNFIVCQGVMASCGKIRDGVVLQFKDDDQDFTGGFVMSFTDLQRLYEGVRDERKRITEEASHD